MRRGTARNSPPESVKSADTRMNTQSPDNSGIASSRTNSTSSRRPSVHVTLPLQSAGFNSSATFQQQNRWMTPLPPQQNQMEIKMPMPSSTSGGVKIRESYNTMPPIPMNHSHATPSGLSFSSVNSYTSVATPSTAYTSDVMSQPTQGHVSAEQNYDLKPGHHYL